MKDETQITKLPSTQPTKRNFLTLPFIEKYRPHIDLERAAMAIRFDEAFVGMQFHPEADALGMRMYLLREDKKELVIEKHGERKYWEMLDHLNDPDKIMLTYSTVVPRFLMTALGHRLSSLAI